MPTRNLYQTMEEKTSTYVCALVGIVGLIITTIIAIIS